MEAGSFPHLCVPLHAPSKRSALKKGENDTGPCAFRVLELIPPKLGGSKQNGQETSHTAAVLGLDVCHQGKLTDIKNNVFVHVLSACDTQGDTVQRLWILLINVIFKWHN